MWVLHNMAMLATTATRHMTSTCPVIISISIAGLALCGITLYILIDVIRWSPASGKAL